jgi:hypothetical protein
MAAAGRHAAQLLVVDVEQRTGMAGHVAHRCGSQPVSVAQAAQAGPAQGVVDGRQRMAG